ncbi:MAG: TorD/DmsD family molecular chaperone [Coriobacteriales bacterium]|jgi:TorA maturation chaperone TorD
MVEQQIPPSALLSAISEAFTFPVDGIQATTAALESWAKRKGPDASDEVRDLLAASRELFDATEAQLAYTRLFIGSFQMEAPPYASYYMDGGLIGGKTTSEVRAVYRQFDIEISDERRVPEDHLRYLLAFLSLMAMRFEQTQQEAFVESYEDFRDGYVLPWLPAFVERVKTHAEQAYYGKLADFTLAVLEGETPC